MTMTTPRDLLMHDFMTVETSQFPSKGGHQVGTATLASSCTALLIQFCWSGQVLLLAVPSAANTSLLCSYGEYLMLW